MEIVLNSHKAPTWTQTNAIWVAITLTLAPSVMS